MQTGAINRYVEELHVAFCKVWGVHDVAVSVRVALHQNWCYAICRLAMEAVTTITSVYMHPSRRKHASHVYCVGKRKEILHVVKRHDRSAPINLNVARTDKYVA